MTTLGVRDANLCIDAYDGTMDALADDVDHLVGQGLGPTNGNEVRVYTADGVATAVRFVAYGAGKWGVNVGSGNIDGGIHAEILTGPGPGAVFGPQARPFDRQGTVMGKVNFYAYGTLRYGVNVATADLERDGYDEILTGAGPGVVFGPHVRAFDFDGGSLAAMGKISFFAYGTLKYGANVGGGDVESDGYDELITGPGPGAIFGPQVRGFEFDGSALAAIAKINFNAFATPRFGVNVAAGDVDGDFAADVACAPGPGLGSGFPSRFVAFHADQAGVTALPGFDVTLPIATSYGGRFGLGDMTPDGGDDLLAGAGRDPAADSTVRTYDYTGTALVLRPGSFQPFGAGYGVNVAGARLDQ